MIDRFTGILDPEQLPLSETSNTDAIIEKIIQSVKSYSPNANTDMIYVAYMVAKNAHKNQFRKSGAHYIEHPVQIAYIASQFSLDATAISACLLHDVVEDTPYKYEDIVELFGKSVADLVDGVTKLKKIKYTSKEEQQVENHKDAAAVGAGHIREFPDIADPDRASGAYQNETES